VITKARTGSSAAASIELRVKPATRLSSPEVMSQPRETSTFSPPTVVSMPLHG
jgi:hypothetical protein